MGQKPVRHTLQAEAASGDADIGMDMDESVLILIKHCQDMKQQETHLRLITLLLLLSCTALFIFTTGADLRQTSGHSEQRSTAEPSSASAAAYQQLCPADNPQTNVQRLHVYLKSVPAENITDRLYMKWYKVFGDNYNDKKRAIVIPETGYYFVYATFALSCQDEVEDESFKKFYVTLHRWNEGYRQEKTIGSAMDGIECSSDRSRSVFMGQLFYLLNGDHVSVWIEEGYKLITKSSFGAYST
ncbi:uncharacterized protein LOC113124814 [Mastacembelus armatus]|uniref:uncharacterized protein LOC113124814 n=1 Tax=Mastacembelus armatus TaxID=205130 RepID=UPI000E461C75|nr:uncharacterized protein LOC113124814 [Mastacembelus armatus]